MVVTILGKEYPVRELSLAQKNNLFSNVGELLRSVFKHVFVKKNNNSGISLDCDDEVALDALNVDALIMSSINSLPELLALAVPDFHDWDNLPESESREALNIAVEVQDLKGVFLFFFLSIQGRFPLELAIIHSHIDPDKLLHSYPESYARKFLLAALMPPFWIQELLNSFNKGR